MQIYTYNNKQSYTYTSVRTQKHTQMQTFKYAYKHIYTYKDTIINKHTNIQPCTYTIMPTRNCTTIRVQ